MNILNHFNRNFVALESNKTEMKSDVRVIYFEKWVLYKQVIAIKSRMSKDTKFKFFIFSSLEVKVSVK